MKDDNAFSSDAASVPGAAERLTKVVRPTSLPQMKGVAKPRPHMTAGHRLKIISFLEK